MTKFILVMYMCSMATGECPSNHIRIPEPVMPRTKPKIST